MIRQQGGQRVTIRRPCDGQIEIRIGCLKPGAMSGEIDDPAIHAHAAQGTRLLKNHVGPAARRRRRHDEGDPFAFPGGLPGLHDTVALDRGGHARAHAGQAGSLPAGHHIRQDVGGGIVLTRQRLVRPPRQREPPFVGITA